MDRITEMEITWRIISEEGDGQNGEKGIGNNKNKWQVQNRQVVVKNSMGNGEAEEFICMTHGHELRWMNDGGRWGTGQRGIKGRRNGTSVIA